MSRGLIIALCCALSLQYAPAQAGDIKNYEILETIKIPENINELEPNYTRAQSIVSSEDHFSNFIQTGKKKKKAKVTSSKKFGPVKVNFLLNPFRMNRTGITFDIDLLESMRILSSHQSLEESFKASAEHHIITDEVKSQLHKVGSWFKQSKTSLN
ncbi:MAG: hypothetical protein OXU45_09350 [Candidatus Melainabacteria bacterium]|nr:hypothetical protein [Candidatus Melainabacteria bacterium]